MTHGSGQPSLRRKAANCGSFFREKTDSSCCILAMFKAAAFYFDQFACMLKGDLAVEFDASIMFILDHSSRSRE